VFSLASFNLPFGFRALNVFVSNKQFKITEVTDRDRAGRKWPSIESQRRVSSRHCADPLLPFLR